MPVLDITGYEPLENDKFIFDTNIWISIFEPMGNSNKVEQEEYSSFFNKTLSSKSNIYISSLIISEFVNTVLRMDFNFWKEETGNKNLEFKKDYRKTDRCKEKSTAIANNLTKGILSKCICVNDNLKKIGIKAILNNLENSDFNDLYILELAKTKGYKIVTNDKDFYKSDEVSIFSCMRKKGR